MENLENKKNIAQKWFKELRDSICDGFLSIENDASDNYQHWDNLNGAFERKDWRRANTKHDGGGGTISLMQGKVFEKVGVNISTVFGEFSDEFKKSIPGAEQDPRFWASGISVVAHPRSPFVPIAHMNTRMIVTTKQWFGGGGDLTPIFPIDRDTEDFHLAFKSTCDKYNTDYYPQYKEWCDKYFFLPHRNEMRGVGGIFFDSLNSGDWNNDFTYTQDVGKTFLDVYSRIIRRNMNKQWATKDQEAQSIKRGRYVEFNLIHDRGTKFGLMTGGNTEAILMSLPPSASWK